MAVVNRILRALGGGKKALRSAFDEILFKAIGVTSDGNDNGVTLEEVGGVLNVTAPITSEGDPVATEAYVDTAVAAAGGAGNEKVLVDEQISVNGGQGLLAAMALYMNLSPAEDDTFVIHNGTSPQTFTFKNSPAGANEVGIGNNAAETLANLALGINADASGYRAVLTKKLADIQASGVLVLHETSGNIGVSASRVYGSTTNPGDIQVLHFHDKTDYSPGAAVNLPSADPGAGRFGVRRLASDLINGESHFVFASERTYRWDADFDGGSGRWYLPAALQKSAAKKVLIADQLTSGGGVNPALVLGLNNNLTDADTISFKNSSATETYTAVAGAPNAGEFQIGADIAATLQNLAAVINDESNYWNGLYLQPASSPFGTAFVVVYQQSPSDPTSRVYGTIAGGQSDVKLYDFSGQEHYEPVSNVALPETDPVETNFGYGQDDSKRGDSVLVLLRPEDGDENYGDLGERTELAELTFLSSSWIERRVRVEPKPILRQVVLSSEQFLSTGIIPAVLMQLIQNLTALDEIVIRDDSTTETYVAVAGSPNAGEFQIGGSITDTVNNLIAVINNDSMNWNAYQGSLLGLSGAFIIAEKTPPSGKSVSRVYGTIAGGQDDVRVYRFDDKPDYALGSGSAFESLSSSDSGNGNGMFGFSLEAADLNVRQGRLFEALDQLEVWGWDRDGAQWKLVASPNNSAPSTATSGSGGGTEGIVTADEDKGLLIAGGIMEVKLDGTTTEFDSGSVRVRYDFELENQTGSTITAGTLVKIETDGTISIADKDDDLSATRVGIAMANIPDTQFGKVRMLSSIDASFSGMTPGAYQYVGDAGARTETEPSTPGEHIYCIGQALDANNLAYDPEYLGEVT